nr:uncharacterized protein LOC128698717 [Cherax quadricarinatus]
MEGEALKIFKEEEDLEEPVPVQELKILEEETRIASSVYRHVVHQQAVEEVAEAAALHPRQEFLVRAKEEPGTSPSGLPLVQRFPSLPHSAGGSDRSESGMQLRYSGTGSTDAGDSGGRDDSLEELMSLPPTLETALKINMTLQRNYRERIQDLEKVLQNSENRLRKLKEEISEDRFACDKEYRWDPNGKAPMRISHFCVPYFKNRSGMNAPKNEDAKFKVDNGYLDLYTTRTRPWMVSEGETLENVVLKEWKEYKIKTWNSKLRELERKQRNMVAEQNDKMVKTLDEEIKECKSCIDVLHKTPSENIRPKRGAKMDWEKIAAQAFDGHRSSEECRLQWENLLHPLINRSPWTEEEDLALQEVVLNSGPKVPDWEAIADYLNTNRTAFLVMQRWVSFIDPALHPAKWTPETTQRLIDTVNMLRIGTHIPWAQVHQHMVGFSRAQLQSRWRMINPEQSKGPFTVEEDFILIKGLHMFGLNFANIAHFMPGRSVIQVRDRFKRTILLGITSKPWTRELLLGTIFLQAPPPLFPVSMTVDPVQIKEIRKHLLLENNRAKELVDRSRRGMDVKSVVKELENRRLMIKARKADWSVERMKRATERRGRRPGVPNPHHTSVPELLLIDFFIPCRHYPTNFSNACKLIEQLFTGVDCEACTLTCPESIPLLPPNQTTLGALRSLLLNRPKLTEMASDNFLFLNATRDELVRLGLHPKSSMLRRCGLSGMPSMDKNYSEETAAGSNEDQNISGLVAGNVTRLRWEVLPESLPGPSGWHPGEYSGVENEGKSDVACRSDLKASGPAKPGKKRKQSPMKIHITSMMINEHGQKNRPKKRKCSLYAEKRGEGRINTYPSGKHRIEVIVPGDEPAEPPVVDSGSLRQSAKTEQAVQDQCQEEIQQPERQSRSQITREHSEKLLFERMLSIFFWPAMMTIIEPPYERIVQTNVKIIQKENMESPDSESETSFKKKSKIMLTKDELDIKEQEQYIHQLSKKDMEYRAWTLYQKNLQKPSATNFSKKGNKPPGRIERENTDTTGDPVAVVKDRGQVFEVFTAEQNNEAHNSLEVDVAGMNYKRIQGKGKGRARGRPQGSVMKRGPGRPRGRKSGQRAKAPQCPEIKPEELASLVVPVGENTGVALFRRKQNLTSLRRSLVMKKIWEGRRNGSLPPRTSERDKRNYKPRGSRTRDSVRKELLKPPKTPNPWDLPLDGPMRVQPQVPLDYERFKLQPLAVLHRPSSSGNQASTSHEDTQS